MISRCLIFAVFFTPFVFAQLGDQCVVNQSSASFNLIAHPTNCSKFLNCDNGISVEMECPARLQFNAMKKVCDWPSQAGCTTNNNLDQIDIADMLGEDAILGQRCHPSDIRNSPKVAVFTSSCEKFLICAGVWTLMNCPQGLLFSVETGHCEHAENAKCCPTCQSAHQKCSKEGMYHSNPIDCHKFYVCQNKTLVESNCANGTIFSAFKGECIKGTSCASLLLPSPENLPSCPIEGALYPNYQSCKKFYICNGGTIVEQTCSPNKFFSIKHNNCQYKPNAICATELKVIKKQWK